MRPIKLVYNGFDSVINEHWAEVYDAFLLDDEQTVIRLGDGFLQIYRFPGSLAKKDRADYFPVDDRIKRAEVYFDGINVKPSDIMKPFAEIIKNI